MHKVLLISINRELANLSTNSLKATTLFLRAKLRHRKAILNMYKTHWVINLNIIAIKVRVTEIKNILGAFRLEFNYYSKMSNLQEYTVEGLSKRKVMSA